MKEWLTAQELTDLQLKSLPKSKSNVISRAKKEHWLNRKRVGRGGGLEYAFDGLPKDVQAEIKAQQVKAEMKALTVKVDTGSRAVALLERDLGELTHEQRQTADARLMLTLLVAQYEAQLGTRSKAVAMVSDLSRQSALPSDDGVDYNEVCRVALAKQSSAKAGIGTRKLHEWCLMADKCESAEDRLKLLAPQKQGQPVIKPVDMAWLPDFLAVFRNTKGYHVSEAYRVFSIGYATKVNADEVPNEDTVRRALKKFSKLELQVGRLTGSKLKALMTYVKRDWNTSWFMVNDVWVGDGKSMEFKVSHPDHGRPFTPELTVIMDTTCRYVVGWSVAYSESTLAVADALRHGMVQHGIPAIYYSDNGSGQTNKALDADVMGILPRLGVHHETGIPGNPQGRGIIERFNKTVPRWIAMQFETFYGSTADDESVRKTLYAVNSLAKAESEGKSLTPLQKKAQGKLPSWRQFIEVVDQAVSYYNNEWEHSELGTTPAAYRAALLETMAKDGEFVVPLTEVEARDMFRPHFVRKVQRAWLSVLNNNYWHKALEALDGVEVVAYVDIHDPSSVIVRHHDGRYICDAVLDGNKRDAFPKSLVERKREERAKRHINKQMDKIAMAQAELRPAIEHENTMVMRELVRAEEPNTGDAEEIVLFAWRAEQAKIINK